MSNILRFNNSDDIRLNFEKTVQYMNCRIYDSKIMNLGYIWHQIVVMHKGKVKCNESKRIILDAIFDVVGDEEFFPVAYRKNEMEDYFLVRQCSKAMDRLFSENLRIRLCNGLQISLKIQLNVAEYKIGQIEPKSCMSKAINRLCENLETIQGETGLLNLSHFGGNIEFDGIEIFLSNRSVLVFVCDMIYKSDEYFRHINGIILSYNRIRTISPLQIIQSSEFTILDLRYNSLCTMDKLCRDLQYVKARKLMLAGNPVTNTVNYPLGLISLSKNFKYIDELPTESLAKDYTPSDTFGNFNNSGYKINTKNKVDIYKFEKSNKWHSITIPDPNQEFTKEEIIDYFFISVSNDCEPTYPCYYKFSSGEHQFLLRNCFAQILHLLEICNLEIKIPRLFSEDDVPSSSNVMYRKIINYDLHMEISPFNVGEIEPVDCIEKALVRRYNAMDRLLDLDNFQNSPGLENIVVKMTSLNVLNHVISIAGRKFLSACAEIRLSNNKILLLNISKALSLMNNIKAIDLGNNWIHDLKEIVFLKNLKLKALRLDGNPICSQFSLAADYIKAVRKIFPDLHKLDNVEINTAGNLSCQKNYLCDVGAYDFVEQFVPYYFQTFESNKRNNLKGLYHQNAFFTMTCKYKPLLSTPQNINRQAKYKKFSRNILSLPDTSLGVENVFYGLKDVMNVLMALPNMTFDLLSFTVDVPIFTDHMIVITITGVFSDQPESIVESEIVLGFSRTFMLKQVENKLGVLKCSKSYQIFNDMFSVHNPSELQLKNSFKYVKNDEDENAEETSSVDKEALLVIFQEITRLKGIWCARCLDDANYNFEKALEVFTELCDKNEFPETAFI